MTDLIDYPSLRRLRRARKLIERLQATIALVDTVDRHQPVPAAFAGEARRACTEAAAFLGSPAPRIKNRVLPGPLIVTVASLLLDAIALITNTDRLWIEKNGPSFRRSSARV
jgi:hypothetical protein